MPTNLALHQNYTNIGWHASKAGTPSKLYKYWLACQQSWHASKADTLSKQYKKVADIPTKTELWSWIILSVDFGKYF